MKTWTRREKKDRNERLLKFAQEHPDYTYKAIGRIFHIDASRVARILKKFSGDDGEKPVI